MLLSNLLLLLEILTTHTLSASIFQVDPSLIGGMVVSIGDKYVDMSMATKIKNYTNLIKQAV